MEAEAKILFWWFMFGGTHVLGSSVPVRTRIIGAVGLPGFKGIYTLVSFATFIPLCMTFARNKHAGGQIFPDSAGLELLAQVLILFALVALFQGLTTPNPMTTVAEMSGKFSTSARGIQRITRHPSNTAFALWGSAHCLANPRVGDWMFFGGFVVYAILSAMHQDKRVLASGPEEFKQFHADTSAIPFGAILAGKQKLATDEFNVPALAIAVVLFAVLRIFHGSIFGGFGG